MGRICCVDHCITASFCIEKQFHAIPILTNHWNYRKKDIDFLFNLCILWIRLDLIFFIQRMYDINYIIGKRFFFQRNQDFFFRVPCIGRFQIPYHYDHTFWSHKLISQHITATSIVSHFWLQHNNFLLNSQTWNSFEYRLIWTYLKLSENMFIYIRTTK